jgi:glutamate racemase
MIGIFDSGVGGLSILRTIQKNLPEYSFCYLADQAHVPYGVRPLRDIQTYSIEISRWLISQGARLIVIACNTASGAALQRVRKIFPEIPFVGLVPAVKPAAEQTQTGKIAVLATAGTFRGKLYLNVKNQYAKQVIVYQETCPGLVKQIENGEVNNPTTIQNLRDTLTPLLENGIDKVVLGCTHYPFAAQVIQDIVGPQVEIIDPAPAIVKRVAHMLELNHILPENPKSERFISTDTSDTLQNAISNLLHDNNRTVEFLQWSSEMKLNEITG